MRLIGYDIETSLVQVSIHASVKDATFQGAAYAKMLAVSIHASVKDATYLIIVALTLNVFQSTHL